MSQSLWISPIRKTLPCARIHVQALGVLCLVLIGATGCQKWPGSQQASQFQIDRERLLGEFRAEKKRAEDLAARNRMLEQRLAESEKAIARQNLADGRASSRGRVGSELRIGNDRELASRNGSSGSALSSVNTSRAMANPSRIPNGRGLPDTRTGVEGQFTSTGSEFADPMPAKDQWRPRSR
ncbi:hypothetical protein VN12_10325 [Pirellula sp. SH-Sr6A]|uniref:hypothetical protein n=1 Tax=Pirellula sp. SH-Sr6A TaxID=1632865 RepID=UPI00078BC111|nr:hypothetical protein [Pirellula sp. SH-Sr6A]AMV32510.1 hypothetical protein VN12_10325 [Pirellula sp. SH-Sr6A]